MKTSLFSAAFLATLSLVNASLSTITTTRGFIASGQSFTFATTMVSTIEGRFDNTGDPPTTTPSTTEGRFDNTGDPPTTTPSTTEGRFDNTGDPPTTTPSTTEGRFDNTGDPPTTTPSTTEGRFDNTGDPPTTTPSTTEGRFDNTDGDNETTFFAVGADANGVASVHSLTVGTYTLLSMALFASFFTGIFTLL